MKRRLLAGIVAGTLLTAPATLHAQLRTSLTIAGGLSAPVSTLADQADAGYNAAAGLAFSSRLVPAGVRIEAGLNGVNGRGSGVTATPNIRIVSGTVNGTWAIGPVDDSPYLIGGVGAYNRRYELNGTPSPDRTAWGFNVGAGLHFPLGAMSTFVEARYHQMLGNDADGTSYRFIPVTFGVSF